MSKLGELSKVIEEIDLEDASIQNVHTALSKCKQSIDAVLSEPHPDDDQAVTDKLKEASESIGEAISALDNIKEILDGK